MELSISTDRLSARPGIITAQELGTAMRKPGLAIKVLDVRSREAYADCHIAADSPGQVVSSPLLASADVDEDGLINFQTLRGHLAGVLSTAEVEGDPVLVFVSGGGMELGIACRAAVLFQAYGYPPDKLYVLDGGVPLWRELGFTVAAGLPPEPRWVEQKRGLAPNWKVLARRKEVEQLADADIFMDVLLDVRDAEEWAGKLSSPGNRDVTLRGGRIRNSQNMSWDELAALARDDDSGSPLVFARKDRALAAVHAMNLSPETPILIYCYRGVRASFVYWSLVNVLGFTNVRIYLEGWKFYGRTASADTIETGLDKTLLPRTFGLNRTAVSAFLATRRANS